LARPRHLVADISLVTLSAIFYTLASSPFEWSLLGWVALTPLFIALRDQTFWRSFLLGLFFGVLICVGVAHWMYSAIATYFVALFPLNLVLTVLSFVVFVGIYTSVTAGIWSIVMQRSSKAAQCIAIPALWVLCEFARSTFLSGFAWGLLGYSQYRNLAIIQIADLTGIYGISFLLVSSSYAVSEVIFTIAGRFTGSRAANCWFSLSFAVTAILVTLAYGKIRLHEYSALTPQASVRIAMVIHNMGEQNRWSRNSYIKSLLNYVQLTRIQVPRASTDLLVWPEYASGLYIDQDPMARLELSTLTRAIEAPLLLGAPRITEDNQYYNSAYLLAPGGKVVDTYDKMRLLPFAEYHPLGLPFFGERRSDLPAEFTAGTRATVFTISKMHFGVLICYEISYPGYARNLSRRGAQFLVNISNDVWLSGVGGNAAASQHFAMAVLRAVENKRALAGATVAGITGFVDEVGRPYDLSEENDQTTVGVVTAGSELTIYTRFGDWLVGFCAICTVLCLIAAAMKGSPSQ
jgi:apolipoprotein N-acyltransferase